MATKDISNQPKLFTSGSHIKMKYYWIITKDRIEDGGAKGVSNGYETTTSNKAHFSMYDDDDICYYEGTIYGDYDGFEPLDDFGMPNAGCTYIKINGETV